MAPKKQTTQEALLQQISQLEAKLSSLATRSKTKTDELQQKIHELQNHNTRQKFIERIKVLELQDHITNFSVECNIADTNSEEKSSCIVFGRPRIAESASIQQRHITPYSFSELIVERDTTALVFTTVERSREQLKKLIQPLNMLDSFTSLGLGFTNQGFTQLCNDLAKNQKDDVHTWLKITTKLDSNNRDYYLAHPSISKLITKTLAPKALLAAQLLYKDKMQKLLQYTIKELSNDIVSYDSMVITHESLVKLVLMLYNNRPGVSLPNDKWHTLDYSIRLYSSSENAKKNKGTFKTFTSDELYDQYHIAKVPALNGRIRIVEDEGWRVRATIESLKTMSEIMQLLKEDLYDSAGKQINSYNTLLKNRKVLEEYESQLKLPALTFDTTKNKNNVALIMNKIYQNIPLHLYHVFDFKPLEHNVFVPMPKALSKDNQKYLSVYAKGNKLQDYYFQEHLKYRDAKTKPDERSNAKFLAHKVVDHVVTSILAFFNFEKQDCNNLLKKFSQKITAQLKDYSVKKEEYNTVFQEYSEKYEIFVSTSKDTVSEIIGADTITHN